MRQYYAKYLAWMRSSWKILDISSCNPNIPLLLPAVKTHISPIHTSLFLSHRLVFPVLVPVPAPFPQSGRHRSVPCLYLLCVLWQNRGKWLWRWRGPRALWLNANKKLLSYRARCDKVGWCRQRERESLVKPPSAVRSRDRKSTHSEAQSRPAVCYH